MIQELVWTIIGRLLFILFLLICIPLFIVFMLLPQRVLLRSNLFFTFEHIFHATVLMLSRLSITYKGQENISAEPAIFVSNHQSSFDIPLVGYCMKGHPHVWLSLAELKNSFLLRFVLPKIAILVDMTNPMSGVKTLRQATELLLPPQCMLLFFLKVDDLSMVLYIPFLVDLPI